MTKYTDLVAQKAEQIKAAGSAWAAINPEYAARMELQNRFKTGLDIARYTAGIMRKDMADYDVDSSKYTQSLGCWHGFTAQQMMMAVKRHPQNHRQILCLSVGLDGGRAAFRFRPAA